VSRSGVRSPNYVFERTLAKLRDLCERLCWRRSTRVLGSAVLSFDFEPASQSEPCPCCGGRTTQLTRFVYRDGDAYAVYYARFSDNHPDRSVVATISLGEWGDGAESTQRVAFAFELRLTPDSFQVGLIDADASPWHDEQFIGRTLNREEALKHPRVSEVYHITDHMVVDDLPLKEHLEGKDGAA